MSSTAKTRPAGTRRISSTSAVVEEGPIIKDIWTQIAELSAAEEGKKVEVLNKDVATAVNPDIANRPMLQEATIIVLGSRQSGKTSLINAYMNKDKEDAGDALSAKANSISSASSLLDYKYTRISGLGMNQNSLVHFWELGGGRRLVQLLDLIITPEHIADTLVLIAVDLSKPSKALDHAQFWMQQVRTRSNTVLAKMKADGSNVPAQMRTEAMHNFGEGHSDISRVDVCHFPIIVVPCKFDLFKDKDTEVLKVTSKALRSLAHINGASLLYFMSGNKPVVQALRARITRHIQGKSSGKSVLSDHNKPINITAGADSFSSIGDPPGGSSSSPLQAWAKVFIQLFPPKAEDDDEVKIDNLDLKPEPSVDAMVAQKEDELKRLVRESQFQRRMKQADTDYKTGI